MNKQNKLPKTCKVLYSILAYDGNLPTFITKDFLIKKTGKEMFASTLNLFIEIPCYSQLTMLTEKA